MIFVIFFIFFEGDTLVTHRKKWRGTPSNPYRIFSLWGTFDYSKLLAHRFFFHRACEETVKLTHQEVEQLEQSLRVHSSQHAIEMMIVWYALSMENLLCSSWNIYFKGYNFLFQVIAVTFPNFPCDVHRFVCYHVVWIRCTIVVNVSWAETMHSNEITDIASRFFT